MNAESVPPVAVVEGFALEPRSIAPLPGGLINLSFAARQRDAGDCVLQRVNPIFAASVNEDIDAITRHLHARGLTTPRLVPAPSGARWIEHEGEIWRLLTRIAGRSFETITTDEAAREAGRVLGAFHAALADYDRPLAHGRPPVHDLARHLAALGSAVERHRSHAARAQVAALADAILGLAAELEPLPALPARLVHGDPKISNVIFAGERAVCLVDLDTIARTPVPLELGDAVRSWCNVAAEDAPESRLSLARFRAAMRGYRAGAGALLSAEEWRAVPAASLAIALELAARFAADALAETYFAWDRRRFASASAHNLARATAQLELARSLAEAQPAMTAALMTEP